MNYPTLRLGVLEALSVLKIQYDGDQTMLDPARGCPYDGEVVKLLKSIFRPKIIETVALRGGALVSASKPGKGRPAKGQINSEAGQIDAELEVEALMRDLTTLSAEAKMDTNDKLSVLRTKTTLIDKLILMRERMVNMKQMQHFQTVVTGILDDLCTEANRAEFLRRLEPFRNLELGAGS